MVTKRVIGSIKSLRAFNQEVIPERLFELGLIFSSLLQSLTPGKRPSGFVIGPTNSANQASAWAKALNAGARSGNSISTRISGDGAHEWFEVDYHIKTSDRVGFEFRERLINELFLPRKAVLLESLRPYFAFRKRAEGFAAKFAIDDLLLLRRMGKAVGVVFHGSDIRDPLAHAMRNPNSPFSLDSAAPQAHADHLAEMVKRSQGNRDLLPKLRAAKIPTFVTTPDLFIEVPDAKWLPAVLDMGRFEAVATSSKLFTSEKLRVLYIPSSSWIKSANLITPILEKLRAEGVIEWANWVENGAVRHDEITELLANSDIVVDQFMGVFGVFALEAIASGRIVLTYLDEAHSPHPTPPHINVTPETLEREIRRVAIERESTFIRAQKMVLEDGEPRLNFIDVPLDEGLEAGTNFLCFYHDGRYSAGVMRENLGLIGRKHA